MSSDIHSLRFLQKLYYTCIKGLSNQIFISS